MANDYDDHDEDDVIIEGSDLHKALTNIGCTDFECTPIERSEFHEHSSRSDDHEFEQKASSGVKPKWIWKFTRKLDNCWMYKSNMKNIRGVKQLEVISKLDPLLDDHSVMIQNMLKEDRIEERKRNVPKWPIFIVSNSMLAVGTFLYKSFRIPGFVAMSSIIASVAYRTYDQSRSIESLKELIQAQNDIYYLYKRILKLLKNTSSFKSSHKQSPRKLNDLEIRRMKYFQPLCEHFMQSMEKTTKICYKVSLLLRTFVCQTHGKYCTENSMTTFDESMFIFEGEITYEKLKQHYYMYILIQSEMMQILAIFCHDGFSNHSDVRFLTIIKPLLRLFKAERIKLSNVTEQYKSFRASTVRHELKQIIGTKLQDLYMHIDLLARKIQSVHDLVISMIDDIDDCRNEDSEAEIVEVIYGKMNEAYKEIDTARNFAEFNNLLIGKLRQNKATKIDNHLNSTIVDKIEQMLPIVHDTDPQIIDEVFEEYIRDEYLKPLYEDNDIESLERVKLDKLLAKNFMSELKEVLIDKYKTMSEREEKALLNHRKKIHNADQDNRDENYEDKVPENSVPPPPPPLPKLVDEKNLSQPEQIKIRVPVPLPRSVNAMFSPTARRRRKLEQSSESEMIETKDKYLMNMNVDIHRIKLPTFMNDEETFIGSGENSDDEIIDSSESEIEKL